jgi:hypothetical protein
MKPMTFLGEFNVNPYKTDLYSNEDINSIPYSKIAAKSDIPIGKGHKLVRGSGYAYLCSYIFSGSMGA